MVQLRKHKHVRTVPHTTLSQRTYNRHVHLRTHTHTQLSAETPLPCARACTTPTSAWTRRIRHAALRSASDAERPRHFNWDFAKTHFVLFGLIGNVNHSKSEKYGKILFIWPESSERMLVSLPHLFNLKGLRFLARSVSTEFKKSSTVNKCYRCAYFYQQQNYVVMSSRITLRRGRSVITNES